MKFEQNVSAITTELKKRKWNLAWKLSYVELVDEGEESHMAYVMKNLQFG